MYLQADQLPNETLLRGFDIYIVGAGAAGLVVAKQINGSSKKGLVLSRGSPADKGRLEEKRQSIYRGAVGVFMQRLTLFFLSAPVCTCMGIPPIILVFGHAHSVTL